MPDPLESTPLWPHAEQAANWLSEGLSIPVELSLTHNRVRHLSIRFDYDRIQIRMVNELLHAPPTFWRLLKKFLSNRRRSTWTALRHEIHSLSLPPSAPRTRAVTIHPQGTVYNLLPILEAVNSEWFPGQPSPQITWKHPHRPFSPFRTRRLADYRKDLHLIRIHPALDDPRVPEDFIRFIVYHERLHAELDEEWIGGRCFYHSPRFREREAQYPNASHWRAFSRHIPSLLNPPKKQRNLS